MKEAFERAEAYLRGEEALTRQDSKKRDKGSWRDSSSSSRRPGFQPYNETRSSRSFEPRRNEERRRSPRLGRYHDKEKQVFTVLTKMPQEILSTKEVKYTFRPPRPLSKPANKRDASKHCAFHNDTVHHTNYCYQLKKRIEEAVKFGELVHLIR